MIKSQFQKTVTIVLILFSISLLLTSCASFSSYIYNKTFAYEPPDRVKISKTEDAVITKLPPEINSSSYDIDPIISSDGKYLYFSRSEGGNLTKVKIYCSEANGTNWQKAEVLSDPPNSHDQNHIGSLSADRQTMIFSSYQSLNSDTTERPIYVAKKINGKWQLTETIRFFQGKKGWAFNLTNNKFDLQTQASLNYPSLSADGTKLLFTSNYIGGYGITDIYMSERTESGKWGEPKNLGPKINTKGIEFSPFLHPDNKTLYFISNGHPGLGKLDIYKSVLKNGEWQTPELLGYPISSSDVELSFSMSADGETAYFTSDRGEPGNASIYRTTVPTSMKPFGIVAFSGKVVDGLTQKPLEAAIIIENLKTGERIAVLQSDFQTGNYFVTLPLGSDYSISVNKAGYTFYSMNFDIPSNFKGSEMKNDIELYPVKTGVKLTLNNVFFDTGSDKLKDASKLELSRAIAMINSYPNMTIEIGGHTDNVGSAKMNLDLSDKRAKSVMKYLKEKGIPQSRMTAKGYGLTVPVASNETEEGRQKNRRVEIIFK
jgi:outer membrane protein OmpA-like peptidoglycan-associated protein